MQTKRLYDIASKKVKPLYKNNTIQDALSLMKQHSISSVVIVDTKNIPIGIFTERDSIRTIVKAVPVSTKLENVMTKDPFTVEGSIKLHDAYAILDGRGFRHLIVIDQKGKYFGIITEGDFIRLIGLDEIENINLVKDIMLPSPLTVFASASIKEVAQLMEKKSCDYAIILNENQKPTAIITERVITHYFANHSDIDIPCINILTTNNMHIIHRDVTLKEAVSLMEKHGVHQLIVVDNNEKIIGFLDRHTVLKAIHGAYINFLLQVIDAKNIDIQELHESEQIFIDKTLFFKNVIDTIPDLIWLKDPDGKYLACNEKFEKFIGKTEEEIIGKTDFDILDKKQAKEFLKDDKEALEKEYIVKEEYLIFANGNYEGIFETIKTTMKSMSNEIIGILGIARDITEKKHQFESLNEAQALTHLGSWKLNIKTKQLHWSDETYKIFGIKKGTPVNPSTFFNLVFEEDKEKILKAWRKVLQGKAYEIEYRIVVQEKIKWVRAKAKLVKNSKNELVESIGTIQDITLTKKYENELLCLANIDQLTGMANRTYLISSFQHIIEFSLRNNTKSALLLIDLDNFKDINDSFGHKVGDEILRVIGKRLQKRMRKTDLIARLCNEENPEFISQKDTEDNTDMIARLGGDEFAIVLAAIKNEEDAAIVAKEINKIIIQPITLSNGAVVHIGSSIGIAISPKHSKDPNELLQFADSALYKAKNNGKLTFAYYCNELTLHAKQRIEGENRLHEAIKNKEFVLYYQPQVHIASGRIIGAESLIRWKDPQKGLIQPDQFISIAEKTGLIVPLGEWILKESCHQAKKWLTQGYKFHISVNISANQIHYYDIAKLIEDTLEETNLPADRLTIELTESAMMRREEHIVQTLHNIRSKGVKIAIDDFGTGYSSYSYLKRFPIDILKIDKSFIDDIPYDKDNVAIVKAIVAMGKALGFSILAEGTELKEQIDFLQEIETDFYQGYYKSKPLPADEFEKLLING